VRPGAPRTSDDLVTVAVGPHGDGLDESLRSQAVGLCFVKRFVPRPYKAALKQAVFIQKGHTTDEPYPVIQEK
jgi:hypothetical protein